MKGTVKIAYWDTEQRGSRPRILGEIKGTPTIRLFKPVTKQGNSNKKKVVLDYNQERKAKDMKKFVDYAMPDFIEHIKGEKGRFTFEEKALRNGLPQVLLFTSKSGTSPLTKFLSTEFRRRILLAQVEPSKTNAPVIEKYGITEFPAMIVIPPPASEGGEAAEIIRYEGSSFSRAKLQIFLSTHALKKAVEVKKKSAPKEETSTSQEESPKKETVKTEL